MKQVLALLCVFMILSVGQSRAQTNAIGINGSYLNVSRPNGGPVSPGDTLEIRAVISIPSGSNFNLTNVSYTDLIANNVAYVPNSIKTVTNENKIVSGLSNTGAYTDNTGDDRAQYQASGKKITVLLGDNATPSAGGKIIGGSTLPKFYAVASIFMVTYRVVVTGAVGSTIVLNSGVFKYSTSSQSGQNGPITPRTLFISPSYLCLSSNSTNLMNDETKGTFNQGSNRNRGTSGQVTGFFYNALDHDNPVDGYYSIVNNTSPTQSVNTGSTNQADRTFNVWDIIGDHGGTLTTAGNAPTAKNRTGGYMLVVNATFAPSIVFTTNLTGLTKNTTYTLSFWVRNLCPACGNDPKTGNAYSPVQAGVKPNLGVYLNNLNYFSTGDLTYTGQWVNEQFTFNTGNSTSMTLDIRNNAPGGGGNDWVLDDITVNKCTSAILPVYIATFSGVARPEGAVLNWHTATEINASYFEIERSPDGNKFTTIGTVPATNNSNGNDYSYTDVNAPFPGTVYYRLHMVDNDGTDNYSKVILIQETGNDNNALRARLVPNPAHDRTTLYITSPVAGNANIFVYDISGNAVHTQQASLLTGQNAVQLQPSHQLAPGMYIVKIVTANRTASAKWIVSQ